MPTDGASKFKSKRIAMLRRGHGLTDGDSRRTDMDSEGLLPGNLRTRLYDLFGKIEREFETIYAENLALQDKIDILNEKLERAVAGEKVPIDSQEHPEQGPSSSSSSWKHPKKSAGSQISQKLKLTYKSSTSKLVSSFKTPTSGCTLVKEYAGHRDGVWEVNVCKADPQVVGTASADHTARLWGVESGSCLMQYLGHTGSVNSVRFHPTQELAVTASGDQTAHVWKAHISFPGHLDPTRVHSSEDELEGSEKEDAEGGDSSDERHEPLYVRQAALVLHGHSSVINAADWLPDGTQVITASWDRTANLYDAETGDVISTLTGHDQELTNVCTHMHQKLLVTSSKDTTFRLWDLRDPSMTVNVFQGHTQHVTTALFASGDRLVSGSDDRTVKVWDLKNMRSPLITIRTDSAVNRLAVNTGQNVIAIPQDNRHIRLYDLSGMRIGRLPKSNRQGHSRMVCSVAWNDRDQHANSNLFSCGFDRHVFGWQVTLPTKE